MKIKLNIKRILTLTLTIALLISTAVPAFAASSSIKVGTNTYNYNKHWVGGTVGLGECFAADGYCSYSIWLNMNTTSETRVTPSEIPETIEGYPVVCLRDAYLSHSADGAAVIFAPEIPKYVEDMENTFKLSRIPAPPSRIPDKVSNLKYTFYACKQMTSFPVLGQGLKDMTGSFGNCTAARGTVELPSGVEKLNNTFADCTNLTEIPDISHLSKVSDVVGAFSNCSKATGGTNLPKSNGFKSINFLFRGCKNMTTPPSEIPVIITSMQSTFKDCSALSGEIDIRAAISSTTPGAYFDAFTGAATAEGAELILNYTTENESAIDDIITKKIITSNIKKGVLLSDTPTEPTEPTDPTPPDGGGENPTPPSNTGDANGEEPTPPTTGTGDFEITDGTGNQDVIIEGIVEPVNTLDVDVPVKLQFIIDENRQIHYTKNAKVISRSAAPLNVVSRSVTTPVGTPKLVADNAFEDWDNLNISQTRNNIAISVNGKNLSENGIPLGSISSAFKGEKNLPLNLSVLYGKQWVNTSRLTFDYAMNLELALAQ